LSNLPSFYKNKSDEEIINGWMKIYSKKLS
jgi:hypothetical protein